jgi:hypothetical protein
MSTPDTFNAMTSDLPRTAPFKAMFLEALETLLTDRPEGFSVADVGWLAWESLPESLLNEAMERFFHREWLELESDNPALARFEREQSSHTKALGLLDEVELHLMVGSEVSPELATELVSVARTLLGGA